MLPLRLDAIHQRVKDLRLCECEPVEVRLHRFIIENRLLWKHHEAVDRGLGTSNHDSWHDFNHWEEAGRTIPFWSDGE